MDIFDEDSLHAEIIRVWGPSGAHAEVFDHMLQELKELRTMKNQALQKSSIYIENYDFNKPHPPRREDSDIKEREFRARSGR